MSDLTTIVPAPSPYSLVARAPISGPGGIVTPTWLHQLEHTAQLAAAAVLQVDAMTHAQRLASLTQDVLTRPIGSVLFETDRLLTYVALGPTVASEVYAGGVYSVVAANVPTGLGASDAGLLVFVTDFSHLFRWDGAAWAWGPGDPGSGAIVAFGTGIVPVPATGWQACNGAATTYIIPSGDAITTLPFTTPVTAGSFFRR